MHSVKKYTLCILTFFCFAFVHKDVTGLYESGCSKKVNACSQMHVKPDHSFESAIYIKPGEWRYTQGTWKLHGDTITFTFKTPPEQLNQQWRDEKTIGSCIQIDLLDTMLTKAVIIHINDGEVADTVSSKDFIYLPASFVVKKIAVTSIVQDSIGMTQLAYRNSNNFLIRTLNTRKDDNANGIITTNEKWLIVGNRIHPESKLHAGFAEFYFRKSPLKNKVFKYRR